MLCHELALLTSLFGVTAARVEAVAIDASASTLVALDDRATGDQCHADWSRVRFTLELTPPPSGAPAAHALRRITMSADRCGGNFSRVRVASCAAEGAEGESRVAESVFRVPSESQEAALVDEQKRSPHTRPYFLLQAPDYKVPRPHARAHARARISRGPAVQRRAHLNRLPRAAVPPLRSC